MTDDCTKCLVRLIGTQAIYCAHGAFEERLGGDYTINGRIIRSYPKTPKWCPGMITEEDAGLPPDERTYS